jgi:hypothetical protein
MSVSCRPESESSRHRCAMASYRAAGFSTNLCVFVPLQGFRAVSVNVVQIRTVHCNVSGVYSFNANMFFNADELDVLAASGGTDAFVGQGLEFDSLVCRAITSATFSSKEFVQVASAQVVLPNSERVQVDAVTPHHCRVVPTACHSHELALITEFVSFFRATLRGCFTCRRCGCSQHSVQVR